MIVVWCSTQREVPPELEQPLQELLAVIHDHDHLVHEQREELLQLLRCHFDKMREGESVSLSIDDRDDVEDDPS